MANLRAHNPGKRKICFLSMKLPEPGEGQGVRPGTKPACVKRRGLSVQRPVATSHSGVPDPGQVEALLKERLGTRVQGLRVLVREGGVVLRGTVYTWYSKQVAQQVAMQELRLTVLANEIEVRWGLGTPGRPEADSE